MRFAGMTGANAVPWLQRLRRSAWTLPLAVAATVLVVGINETTYHHAALELQGLAQRGETQMRIQQIWRTLIDAETAQRGFLLTQRASDLQPYERAREEVEHGIESLERRHAGDATAVQAIAALKEAALDKLSELRTTLDQHRQGPAGAWRELMLTDIGRERMDQLRQASARILDLEAQQMSGARAKVLATLARERWGIALLTLGALLALLAFLRLSLRFERTQDLHARTLQAQRAQLKTEVARRTADLSGLARHLQDASEAERGRLARDLHDELGALLTATKFSAARLRRAMAQAPPEQLQCLTDLVASVDEGIRIKRRLIEELRPSSLDNLGLASALEQLARDFARRHALPVDTDLNDLALSDGARLAVYRFAQEGLTNVSRHAAACRVGLSLRLQPPPPPQATGPGAAPLSPAQQQEQEQQHRQQLQPQGALLTVLDDGVGFDPSAVANSTHGLLGMRYRCESLGGCVQVQTAPGQGTRLEVWLPL